MNRRRRNLLVQICLGLAVGMIVPLAVIGTLLITRDDDGETVRIAPTREPAETPRGLRVTQGKELERHLLTKAELGSGWENFPRGSASQGSLSSAVKAVPETPADCDAFPSLRFAAFQTPYATISLFNNRIRSSVSETIYVFRPGMARETLAYLRGLIARCGTYKEEVRLDGRVVGTMRVTTTAAAGPRLGDESLRMSTRYAYGGGIGGDSRTEGVYVRIGDTVVYCAGTGDLDELTARAVAKIT